MQKEGEQIQDGVFNKGAWTEQEQEIDAAEDHIKRSWKVDFPILLRLCVSKNHNDLFSAAQGLAYLFI
jgi:hypothetical protein